MRDLLGGLAMGSATGCAALVLWWLFQDKSDVSSDFLAEPAFSWPLAAEALLLLLKPPRSRAWAATSILVLRWPLFICLLTQAPNEPHGELRPLIALLGLASSAFVHVPAMVRANILRGRSRPKATSFVDD